MGNTLIIFSIIFSIACAISLFLGTYILYLNPEKRSNRIFFGLTIALDIWAFSFSLAIAAPDLGACLFWRRFSAIGWGSFFSILLHFILDYTEKNVLLKKWWIYLLLYVPSVITILGFNFIPGLNPEQYNLVRTTFGWTNIAINNAWDYYYSTYYMSFSAIGFLLLWQWGRTRANNKSRKQAYTILFSFFLTILLGSLTDILCNSILLIRLPQMAPLLMIFPLTVIYYSIKKFGLMNPNILMKMK